MDMLLFNNLELIYTYKYVHMFIIHIKILHLIIYVNEVQNISMHFLMLIIIPIININIT